jgi:hypothetical protein
MKETKRSYPHRHDKARCEEDSVLKKNASKSHIPNDIVIVIVCIVIPTIISMPVTTNMKFNHDRNGR